MVGRAAVGRPWLVAQIGAGLEGRTLADPTPAVMADMAVEHYEGLLALYGTHVGLRHARKHLAAYADVAAEAGFLVESDDRQRIVTTEEPAVAIEILRRIYASPMRNAA
jgi:tRNA-dihydrouridine synthase